MFGVGVSAVSKYNVWYNELRNQTSSLQSIGTALASFESRLNTIANAMDGRDSTMASLKTQVRSIGKTISPLNKKITSAGAAVGSISNTYLAAEKSSCGSISDVKMIILSSSQSGVFDWNRVTNSRNFAATGAMVASTGSIRAGWWDKLKGGVIQLWNKFFPKEDPTTPTENVCTKPSGNVSDKDGNVTTVRGESVRGAPIVYVSQSNDEDWGRFSAYKNSGCGVASTSMALSSLGITASPEAICSLNLRFNAPYPKREGKPTFMNWDSVGKAFDKNLSWEPLKSTKTLDQALDDYLRDPRKYAPPILNVILNGQGGHYIVITGRKDEKTYTILDSGSKGTIYPDGNFYTALEDDSIVGQFYYKNA